MRREEVVYGLIYHSSKEQVLMVKNVGADWTLPGGAVEKGESLEQAIIREVKEETNLDVQVEHIVAVNEAFFEQKGVQPLFITFMVKMIGGEININYKTEIDEVKWVDIETANSLMPYHPEGIEKLLKSHAPYYTQRENM